MISLVVPTDFGTQRCLLIMTESLQNATIALLQYGIICNRRSLSLQCYGNYYCR